MKKFLIPGLCLTALLGACSSGSSSSSEAVNEEIPSVASEDDLPNCSSKREGTMFTVEESGVTYTCHDGKWEESVDLPKYDTEDDLPNCTAKKEGEKVLITETSSVYVCKDGSWQDDSKSQDGEKPAEGDDPDENKSSSSSETMTLKQAKAACEKMSETDKEQLAEIIPETIDLLSDFMDKSVNSKTNASYQKTIYSELLKQYGGKDQACPIISMGYGIALLAEAMNKPSVTELRNAYEYNDINDWWWLADDNYVGRILKTVQQASYEISGEITQETQQVIKQVVLPALDSATSYFAPAVRLEKYTYDYETDDFAIQLDQSEFATALGAIYTLKGLFTAAICVNLDITNDNSFDWVDGYLEQHSYYGYADGESMKFIGKLMNDQTLFTHVYASQTDKWKSIPGILKKGISYIKDGLNYSLNDADQDYDLFVIGNGYDADFSSAKIQEFIDNADIAEESLAGTTTINYGNGKSVKVNLKKFFEQTDGFMKYMPYMSCEVDDYYNEGECYFTDKNGNITISLTEAKNGDYSYGEESSLFIFRDPTFGGVFPGFTQTSIWDFIRDMRD